MLNFLKQFILHPKQIGSFMPSWPELIKLMLEPIDFSKAQHIVEIGPGDGVITKQLLKHMRKDAKLTVIEINEEFCNVLKKINDKRLHIVNDSALNLSKITPTADYVISALPLVNFSDKETDEFLTQVKKIGKCYVQYNYSFAREKLYKKHFKSLSKKMTLKNVPPAIVYTARP